MSYQTLRQQGQALLETRRYDELQVLLSAEREKVAAEIDQAFPYVPPYLPRFLMGLYGQLLPVIRFFAPHLPSFLGLEANLARQNRRIEIILELEQKLLEALNQEAQVLMAEARSLAGDRGRE